MKTTLKRVLQSPNSLLVRPIWRGRALPVWRKNAPTRKRQRHNDRLGRKQRVSGAE